MTKSRGTAAAMALLLTWPVAGCGLTVPNLRSFTENQEQQEIDENTIVNKVKCELNVGVRSALYDPRFWPPTSTTGRPTDWLLDWGAKVSYILTVTERSSVNPGLSYKNPFTRAGTFFSIGGGVQALAEAQRRETGAVTYAFSDLMREAPIDKPCSNQNGVLLDGDLRIKEFISSKIFITRVPGTTADNPSSIDTSKPQVLNAFSDEITFTVTYGGNITPSWVFSRISINPTAPLFSTQRTKIQFVTITIGPVQTRGTAIAAPQLSAEAQLLDSAILIGNAVSSAIRNNVIQTTPFP